MSKYSVAIRRARKNYPYTGQQFCDEFGFHIQTLRGWVKDFNLPVIQKRPLVIFSEVLREHLSKQLKARKIELKLKEFYCLSCNQAQIPLKSKVHIEDLGKSIALRAICITCKGDIRKKESKQNLGVIAPMFKMISLEELNILGRANSKQKTHLSKISTSHSNEPTKDSHLQQQLTLLQGS
jgi:hypothetical protein